MAVAEAVKAFAKESFKIADDLVKEHQEVQGARRANRELLRNLEAQGSLSADQKKKLNDIYPKPVRKAADGDGTTAS